jgi:hypothetical protein
MRFDWYNEKGEYYQLGLLVKENRANKQSLIDLLLNRVEMLREAEDSSLARYHIMSCVRELREVSR